LVNFGPGCGFWGARTRCVGCVTVGEDCWLWTGGLGAWQGVSNDARCPGAIWAELIGDGRPLLLFTGCACVAVGCCLVLSATGNFCRHDIPFLGMTPRQLAPSTMRIVHFMFHDGVVRRCTRWTSALLYCGWRNSPAPRRRWACGVPGQGVSGLRQFPGFIGYGYLDSCTVSPQSGCCSATHRHGADIFLFAPSSHPPCTLSPAVKVALGSSFGLGRGCCGDGPWA